MLFSLICALNTNNNNNIIIPGAVNPAICTPDLKRFVVHLFNETFNGKPILEILAPCVTVTGTVIGNSDSQLPHIRDLDSDLIINLLPDSEFKSLVTPANVLQHTQKCTCHLTISLI